MDLLALGLAVPKCQKWTMNPRPAGLKPFFPLHPTAPKESSLY